MLKTAQDRGQKKKAKLVSSLQIRAFERRLKFSRSKYTKKYQGGWSIDYCSTPHHTAQDLDFPM